ncbi:MAG: hypothetical protein FWG70_08010 [Oscillospiraceae bacterium]|nr:hypothetical protein [Oscillospiraceae bacterium]
MLLKLALTVRLALITVLCLFLTAAAAFTAVVLVSAGLLAVFVGFGCVTGILKNVASDLSPHTMLLTGLFAVFSALSLAVGMYIICPKAVRRFGDALDNIFN